MTLVHSFHLIPFAGGIVCIVLSRNSFRLGMRLILRMSSTDAVFGVWQLRDALFDDELDITKIVIG